MHAKQVVVEDCGYMWAPAERCSPFKTRGRCEGRIMNEIGGQLVVLLYELLCYSYVMYLGVYP